MSGATRPRPVRGVYEDVFWQHVAGCELRLQRCTDCGAWRYPPGPVCPDCLSDACTWTPLAGRGRLLSWVMFQRKYFDAFPPPHRVVAVETDEGPILLGNLLAADEVELALGMEVEVGFEEVEDQHGRWTIVQWRLVE